MRFVARIRDREGWAELSGTGPEPLFGPYVVKSPEPGSPALRIKRDGACFGGGNRGNAKGADVGQFAVRPSDSFAFKLARYCGQFTVDVTARTAPVSATYNDEHDSTATGYGRRKINGANGWRAVGRGDKATFVTDPNGTIGAPRDPQVWI